MTPKQTANRLSSLREDVEEEGCYTHQPAAQSADRAPGGQDQRHPHYYRVRAYSFTHASETDSTPRSMAKRRSKSDVSISLSSTDTSDSSLSSAISGTSETKPWPEMIEATQPVQSPFDDFFGIGDWTTAPPTQELTRLDVPSSSTAEAPVPDPISEVGLSSSPSDTGVEEPEAAIKIAGDGDHIQPNAVPELSVPDVEPASPSIQADLEAAIETVTEAVVPKTLAKGFQDENSKSSKGDGADDIGKRS